MFDFFKECVSDTKKCGIGVVSSVGLGVGIAIIVLGLDSKGLIALGSTMIALSLLGFAMIPTVSDNDVQTNCI